MIKRIQGSISITQRTSTETQEEQSGASSQKLYKMTDSPSIGTTDGSLMEGDIALLSTAATSASRPRALTGGVEDSLGRLVRLDSPDEEGRAVEVSLLRSAGRPVDAGFRRTAGALDSPPWLFDPRAMKSPGGGWPGKKNTTTELVKIFLIIIFWWK